MLKIIQLNSVYFTKIYIKSILNIINIKNCKIIKIILKLKKE